MEEGCTAFPALCASCTGYLLEARSTGPHACWGISFIMPLKWRVFIYLILYVHIWSWMDFSSWCTFPKLRERNRLYAASDWYLSTSFSYIYWCHPHLWRQQRLHNSSTCLLLLLFRSNILTRCSLYHNHFICTSVPHKMLSDFSFAKLAQAAFCKGRAPRLV